MIERFPAPRRAAPPAGPQATGWRRVLGPLARRDFRYFWVGSFLTSTALWMQTVSLGWYMYHLTNSGTLLGLVGFARSIPMLLFSLLAGILADRMSRRFLLVSTQLAAAAFSVILAVLIHLEAVDAWGLIALAFVSGTALALHYPTRQAIMPALVERAEIPRAVALNSATLNSTRIVGPSVAGTLIAAVGSSASFGIQALAYLAAAACTLLMRLPPQSTEAARAASMWQNMVEGLGYIRGHRAISSLLILAAVPTVFGQPFIQLLPIFARDILRIGPTGLGLLLACSGGGAIVGSLAVASTGVRRQGRVLLAASALFGALLIVFANLTWLPASLLVLALTGVCNAVYMAVTGSLLQLLVPDELRGRVMSVYLLTWGLMPLGTLPAGAVAEHFGAPVAVSLGGVICVVVTAFVALGRPDLRELE